MGSPAEDYMANRAAEDRGQLIERLRRQHDGLIAILHGPGFGYETTWAEAELKKKLIDALELSGMMLSAYGE